MASRPVIVNKDQGDCMVDECDRSLDAFKKIVPHLRGALWWSQNDAIKELLPDFNQHDDHYGHPILSIRKEEVCSRADAIPMLLGTTGRSLSVHKRNCCIDVMGMTKEDPEHHTYFGSLVEPMIFSVAEMMSGVVPKKGEYQFREKNRNEVGRHGEKAYLSRVGFFEHRKLKPNWDKPVVSPPEMEMIDAYCIIHNL